MCATSSTRRRSSRRTIRSPRRARFGPTCCWRREVSSATRPEWIEWPGLITAIFAIALAILTPMLPTSAYDILGGLYLLILGSGLLWFLRFAIARDAIHDFFSL